MIVSPLSTRSTLSNDPFETREKQSFLLFLPKIPDFGISFVRSKIPAAIRILDSRATQFSFSLIDRVICFDSMKASTKAIRFFPFRSRRPFRFYSYLSIIYSTLRGFNFISTRTPSKRGSTLKTKTLYRVTILGTLVKGREGKGNGAVVSGEGLVFRKRNDRKSKLLRPSFSLLPLLARYIFAMYADSINYGTVVALKIYEPKYLHRFQRVSKYLFLPCILVPCIIRDCEY